MWILERRRRENSANDNKRRKIGKKTWGRSEKRMRQRKTEEKEYEINL
jgi:hypothetical protein